MKSTEFFKIQLSPGYYYHWWLWPRAMKVNKKIEFFLTLKDTDFL
jgi:hypothetical protein